MRQRRRLPALLGAFLIGNVACTKDAPPVVSSIAPSDHVALSPVGTSQTVLQKTFALRGSAVFPFEIPAHASQPHLHGIFESFVGQVHGLSDETANIDFMILNEQQNIDLATNRPSEAIFTVEDTHSQAINFDLPASMNQPVKYYLLFRNGAKKGSKVVEANFRVDF